MTRQLINAREAATLLGIGEQSAREVLRRINAEMKKEGLFTLDNPVKVPRRRLLQRFGLEKE